MSVPPDVIAHAETLLARGHSKGWPLARLLDGTPCHPNHPQAAAWSLHGAFVRASHDLQLEHVMQTARMEIGHRLWKRHRLHIAWAELDASFTQVDALELFR